MKTSDFYYDLPNELIAQTPIEPRDASRMMVVNRQTGEIEHKHFYDVIDFLNEGDALIVNDSRVLPARIYGTKIPTGANVEFLLLKQVKDKVWETLDKIGQMPLPPYIHEKLKDKERYQTVYSHELGSAAAPTAGLHFTDELLEKIKAKGIKIGYVTLHVGLGTFRPVKVDDVTTHKMHSEHYEVPEETAKLIEETKKNGKRVIAVGTTSCRTLESVAKEYGKVVPCEGWTDIFIYPGFEFKVLDGLITNFHLPESTLIMLVSAFAGYDEVMGIYKEAVKEKYRFFSFGDSMFIE
ncbi:MAG: tRNA preQ1(34) S-adenosylmethionine ribosyltransferase-isomerase QueA [Ruminococcaceae bacterium]|nr:tRNA preQ1(34) S-adenosylmethionine ribosyltransferase-isomerase QueA [Oscillospiraceae bacterium]